jgi:arginase
VGGEVEERSVVGLLCRTSDQTADAVRGAAELASVLAARMGLEARMIGSPPSEIPSARRWEDDIRDSRGCLLEAGGQIDDALAAGRSPVLVAAECSVAMTTLPAVVRHRPDARILWLDAHADFNTPNTTRSGYLGGMCLAGACGLWDPGLGQEAVPLERLVMCGVRDLEPDERRILEQAGVPVIGTQLETLVHLVNALDDAPVYVHLDLDVLDPAELRARFPVEGGLSYEKLFDLLDAVVEACELVGFEVTCLEEPGRAEDIAEVLDPLL